MAVLTEDDFKGHIMIVGSTGAGKSNLLLYIMQFLAAKGATIIAIDPHGDLALDLKGTVPQAQVYDPVLAPFVLNPMDLGSYSTSAERQALVQRRVGELVDMMKDLFGVEQSRAPRLLWIFRGLLYYLYSITDTPTFLDLYFLLSDLLTDPSKIKRLMQGSDEVIRKSAEAMAELEPAAFTAVMNRISNFVMPAHSYTSRTFCARKTTIDFLSLLEPNKITAFRIPRNELPDDFRKILTSTIVLNVFYAVEKRKKIYDELNRPITPVHLVIDEFQNIADLETLDIILSEARKYGLFLITANQHLTQIPENLLKSMEGNSKLIISFRVGPDDAHELARATGNTRLETLLTTLPNYTAVVKKMDKVYYFRAPKAKYPTEPVKIEPTGPIPEEDRTPIYLSRVEAPPMSPAQWAVLSFVFLNGPQVGYSVLRQEMFRKYAWDESTTLSAINYLLDMGHLRASRSIKEIYYEITPAAIEKFFTSTESVISRRAGGPLHNEIVRKLVRQFWEAGYYAVVDTGSDFESKPDILVFRPEEVLSPSREMTKTMRSPQDWAVPIAYEVETMSNSPEQIKRNLEKNVEKGYRVVFVVPDAESEAKLRKTLGEGEYSVVVMK